MAESPLRILIVEDHEDTRVSLAILLRHRGHVVAEVGTAADALMAVSGRVRLPDVQADHDADVALVRAALGDEAFAEAWTDWRVASSAVTTALAEIADSLELFHTDVTTCDDHATSGLLHLARRLS